MPYYICHLLPNKLTSQKFTTFFKINKSSISFEFLYSCSFYFVLSKFSTVFHWSTIGSPRLAISLSNTRNSTWSTYEINGNWEQTALKVFIISKPTTSLSIIVSLIKIGSYLQISCGPIYILPTNLDIQPETEVYHFLP